MSPPFNASLEIRNRWGSKSRSRKHIKSTYLNNCRFKRRKPPAKKQVKRMLSAPLDNGDNTFRKYRKPWEVYSLPPIIGSISIIIRVRQFCGPSDLQESAWWFISRIRTGMGLLYLRAFEHTLGPSISIISWDWNWFNGGSHINELDKPYRAWGIRYRDRVSITRSKLIHYWLEENLNEWYKIDLSSKYASRAPTSTIIG